jgi:hypothetical protein
MSRQVSDRNILSDFCMRFCRVVEKHSDYIVVSGFVAIASGRIRGTEDIDMIMPAMDEKNYSALHKHLVKEGFSAVQSDDAGELYSYLKDKHSIRYTFKDQPVPEMELKFVKDPLDEYQMKTKVKLPLTGIGIWFSSVNMNVAFKEELLKSQKDMEDARHLRTVYSEMVDESEVRRIKQMIKRYRP